MVRGKLSPSNHCLIRTNCTLRQIIRGFQIIPLRHRYIGSSAVSAASCWTNGLAGQTPTECQQATNCLNMRLDSARYQMVVLWLYSYIKARLLPACGMLWFNCYPAATMSLFVEKFLNLSFSALFRAGFNVNFCAYRLQQIYRRQICNICWLITDYIQPQADTKQTPSYCRFVTLKMATECEWS